MVFLLQTFTIETPRVLLVEHYEHMEVDRSVVVVGGGNVDTHNDSHLGPAQDAYYGNVSFGSGAPIMH